MAKTSGRTEFKDSLLKRVWLDNIYISRLIELWLSIGKYNNLPDTCNPRYMELNLLIKGAVVFFRDEIIGDLCLSVLPRGPFDVYGNPLKRRAYSHYNRYQKELDETNSVIIWNNLLRRPSIQTLIMYGKRISELAQIIDINAKAQKTPILITADEKKILSLKNVYMQYEGNTPVIYGYKDLGSTPITAINTQAPYLGESLYKLMNLIWNEALTYIGIANVNVEKHERLITDEVTRNMGGTVASRYSRLQARNFALNKINDMFGTNISYEYQKDFDILVDKSLPQRPLTGKEGQQ